MDTPDFQELGIMSPWPAVEWSDAWLEMEQLLPLDSDDREHMWRGVCAFGQCGFKPTRVIEALVQALF